MLEEGARFSGTGVIGGYQPLCGCWDLNLGPLQEQLVLLISAVCPGPMTQLLNYGVTNRHFHRGEAWIFLCNYYEKIRAAESRDELVMDTKQNTSQDWATALVWKLLTVTSEHWFPPVLRVTFCEECVQAQLQGSGVICGNKDAPFSGLGSLVQWLGFVCVKIWVSTMG